MKINKATTKKPFLSSSKLLIKTKANKIINKANRIQAQAKTNLDNGTTGEHQKGRTAYLKVCHPPKARRASAIPRESKTGPERKIKNKNFTKPVQVSLQRRKTVGAKTE